MLDHVPTVAATESVMLLPLLLRGMLKIGGAIHKDPASAHHF